jgi:hypothetical protein
VRGGTGVGQIDLPLVGPEMSLAEALETLRLRRRAAVVVPVAGAQRLIKIGELAAARKAGMVRVGQIAARADSDVAELLETVAGGEVELLQTVAGDDLPAPVPAYFTYVRNEPLHRRPVELAFELVADPERSDSVFFVTDHAGYAEGFYDSFVCNGKAPINGHPPHFFPDPNVVAHQRCPFCTTPPGATPPTVSRWN